MEKKILNIVRELFNNNSLTNKSKMGDIDEWDSLGHINIFMAIEHELGISCDPEEVIENDSIKKIVTLLTNKN